MSTIHRITPECQPVFPCWLYENGNNQDGNLWAFWKRYTYMPTEEETWFSHWHHAQPAAPAVTPGAHNGFPPIPLHDGEGSQVKPAPAQGAQSPTPRTDARFALDGVTSNGVRYVPKLFGEILERELNEAKAELERIQPDYNVYAKIQDDNATLLQRLAVVEKQRDGWMEDARIRACNTDHANNKLAAAEAELAALRLDRERLDWLFDRGLCWRDCDKDNPNWIVGPGTEWLYKVHNGRAAIDFAMQQEGRE